MDDKTILNNSGMLPVGVILNKKYRIDGYLASGGFGNTYRATDLSNNTVVAIKEFFMKGVSLRKDDNTIVSVSTPDNKATFYSQKTKFGKEAERLQSLHNKHIVGVHDLFDENGTSYYVMDFVDGETLSERLRRTGRPIGEDEALNILRQVLDALNTTYQANPPILHLDIKPGNIMVDKNGIVKLIDFGASKQVSDEGGATTSSAISYTNGFAPYEQMEKSLDRFGPWTDFYALGATLYNVLSNHKPPMPTVIFDDKTQDKHVSLPFPTNVSDRTRKLVLWMMRPNRHDRPQNIVEILSFLNGDDTVIKDETILDNDKTQLETKKSDGKVWYFVIGAIALIAIVIVVALSSNKNKTSQPVAESAYNIVAQDTARDTAVVKAKEDSIAALKAQHKQYNWTGEFLAESYMGDTAGGTGIAFEILFKLRKGDSEGEYTGEMSIDGWQTGIRMTVYATATDNTLKIWSGKDLTGFKAIDEDEPLVTIYYNSDKTLTADWHLPMNDYTNDNTTIEKLTPERKKELGLDQK